MQDRWRVLLRRKATFPITRFSTDIRGFLLLDDTVRVYDSVEQKEDFYTVRFTSQSSRSLGSGFASQSLELEATSGILETETHPLYLKVSYGATGSKNGIYFDNSSFSFSTSQKSPSLTYDEASSSVSIENGTIGDALTISGFTANSYTTEVIYESGKMIFPSDMRLLYEAPSFEINGIFQPFTNGILENFFKDPLFFERLYLITAKEILYFFTQAQEEVLMQRIDLQLEQNSKQLAAMARALLDKEQQQYHHRSVSSRFWQQYGSGSYLGGTGGKW